MPERSSAARRGVALLTAAVLSVALIGLVTGTAPSSYRAKRPPPQERPGAGRSSGSVPAARTHAELEKRPWGSGPVESGWLESWSIAARSAPPPEPGDPGGASLAAVEEALDARASRRAFDGAPPVVPHPVRASGAAECLACHAEGFALAGRRAFPVPHARYASCTQCHVSSDASFTVVAATRAARAGSDWSGLRSAAAGATAYPGAPPAVPHPTFMRESCDACHGTQGRAPLRTPHPDRRSCLQCHPATGERPGARAR